MNKILLWLYSYLPFRISKYIAMYDCPHSEPLHFHHDGCPSCYFDYCNGCGEQLPVCYCEEERNYESN